MTNFVCQYGLYQWFEEHGTDLIHADDLESFRRFLPNGKVFHCVGVDGEYLILSYGEHEFRLKPQLFKPVPQPARTIGESVSVRSKGEVINGVIHEIMWHFQRAEPFYFVLADGKKLSKQYWKDDFITSP
jgi:hypothetical protein